MSVNHSRQKSNASKQSMNYADIMASILQQNFQLVKKKRESIHQQPADLSFKQQSGRDAVPEQQQSDRQTYMEMLKYTSKQSANKNDLSFDVDGTSAVPWTERT